MTINIYDYTRIIEFKGYDIEPSPNTIVQCDVDSDTEIILIGKSFSKFEATATLGHEYAQTVSEAEGMTRMYLNLVKPDGTVVNLGGGSKVSTTENSLYFTTLYEWTGFTNIPLNNVGICMVNLDYQILR